MDVVGLWSLGLCRLSAERELVLREFLFRFGHHGLQVPQSHSGPVTCRPSEHHFLIKAGITQTFGQGRTDVLRRLPTSVAEGGGELSPRLGRGAGVLCFFCFGVVQLNSQLTQSHFLFPTKNQ